MSDCKRASFKDRFRENWRKNPYFSLACLSMALFSGVNLVDRHVVLPFEEAWSILEWVLLIAAGFFFWKFIVRYSQPR